MTDDNSVIKSPKKWSSAFRVTIWSCGLAVAVIALLAVRIGLGLQEDPRITELRSRASVVYYFDNPRDSRDWVAILRAGLMGRSARNIAGIVFVQPATDEEVEWIAAYARNLKALSLRKASVSATSLQRLRNCQRLHTLDLSRTDFNDEEVAALIAQLPNLQRLVLIGMPVTDAVIPALKQLPALKFVNARDTELTDVAIQLWKQEMPPNRKITIWSNAAGGDMDDSMEPEDSPADDPPQRSDYTPAQQLVVAAFELDVEKVDALLKSGVDPNGRLGFYDEKLFEDKWSLAYSHMDSDRWTALLAVANSHREPQPAEPAENTSAGRDAAEKQRQAVSSELIRERDERRLAIARLLLAAKAGLDLADDHGATALDDAVDNEFNEVALLLIEAGADVNTKTGVYIDGPGDVTPLHLAMDNPVLLEELLKHGADVHAKDTEGRTPLDWARLRENNDRCIQLLLDAGAK